MTTATKRNQRAKAHTRLIADKLHELTRALSTLEYSDLRAIDQDITRLNGTNCWCVEYEFRDAMRRIVGSVILEKDREKRLAAEVFRIEFS